MARCCNVTSKIAIFSINCLTWIVAAGFIFLSIYIFRGFGDYGKLFDGEQFPILPGILLLAVGIVLFILGIVGCIGAVSEHKCIIGLYFSLLLVILFGLVASAGFSYTYRQKIDDELHSILMKGFNKYGENGTMNEMIDDLQQNMHCCGVNNYTDWVDLPWHKAHLNESYPASCCNNYTCKNIPSLNQTSPLYQKGCYVEIKETFTAHMVAIFSVIAACGLVLIIGMTCACMLLRERRNRDFLYTDLTETDNGMGV